MVVGIFVQHAAGVLGEEADDLAALSVQPGPRGGPIHPPSRPSMSCRARRAHARPLRAPTAVATAVFSVPADDVWHYRLDFANLPEYNPDVSGVERVADGEADGVGGVHGPGARYTFRLADARRPGVQPPRRVVDRRRRRGPTLVAAGMAGGSEAYEEFVVRPLDGGGCEATLTLWVTSPEGLPDDVVAAAARAARRRSARSSAS